MPVSSSSVKNTAPPAEGGRCGRITSPDAVTAAPGVACHRLPQVPIPCAVSSSRSDRMGWPSGEKPSACHCRPNRSDRVKFASPRGSSGGTSISAAICPSTSRRRCTFCVSPCPVCSAGSDHSVSCQCRRMPSTGRTALVPAGTNPTGCPRPSHSTCAQRPSNRLIRYPFPAPSAGVPMPQRE